MMAHDRLGLRRRPLLALFALVLTNIHRAHALTQTYCSNQNTGSDYDAVTNIYQSNGACDTECSSDYAFAIVQYQQCWCSNYAPANQVDVSECSSSCPGYPDESCGNSDDGLYGYIALSLSPSGTQGAAAGSTSSSQDSSTTSTTAQSTTPSSSSSSSSPVPPSSSSVDQRPSTVYSSVPVTVTVEPSASVVVSYVTASSSDDTSTSSSTSTSPSSAPPPASTTSFFLSSTQGAAATSASAPSSSLSHTTMVSTRVVTVSGAAITQTVTSTAEVTPGTQAKEQAQDKGISGGTVAGAVVGSVLGVALLLAGAFFLWRRRQSEETDPESPDSAARQNQRKMERNTSVLSRTGLLSTAGTTTNAEKSHDEQAAGTAPASAADTASRRDSRPMLYDQRLNPAALMEHWERNGSRASIDTMQDQRDYSRPLGVTNPDPTNDD